jgi:hypothetical protein
MDKMKTWSTKRSRSNARSSSLSQASISEREWQERRRSASDAPWQVYHRRTDQERVAMPERQAAEGMLDLGTGIVYASVLGLPAPTAPVRCTNPVMSELPRRVEGMHPRLHAYQAMEEGRYTNATQLLPTMVPDRMVDEVTASISLMWIKKGLKGLAKRVRCGFQGKKE